ncbi:MAG: ABC transporter permease [Pirellulaceae bacterium]|nr:ABC transporter permease [Pirellulaceae bacterium]
MVLEDDYFLTFMQWLLPGRQGIGALGWFMIWVPIVALLGLLVGFVRATLHYTARDGLASGILEGFFAVARTIDTAVKDLSQTSARRTFAMARLAVQESLRRLVLVVFAVFLLFVLFAGWFLDVNSDNPARLYMGFVLGMNNMLLLLLALVLSTFSLPSDIRNRTIYTVVTKPVRPSEIILGRVLGFSFVGTVFVVVMCLISYVFVTRGLNHEHGVDPTTVTRQTVDGASVVSGQTTEDLRHVHTFTLRDGQGRTDIAHGHWHEVEQVGEGENATFVVGPPRDTLQARIADYGRLRFLGRTGKERATAYNVGKEWSYRSYVEGGTKSAAIWRFRGITPERYPEGLPLELNLRVFRTHKGDVEKGIVGLLKLRHPDPAVNTESETFTFTAQEFQIDNLFIDRNLRAQKSDGTLKPIDLFEDLVDKTDGSVEVIVQCAEPAQYFGMAEGDVYLRARDGSFFWNFVKGHVAIWLQMVLVVSFGVMFSTFLSGIVAMVATLATVVLGHTVDFVTELATGEVPGGGALESSVRIVRQMNVSAEIDANVGTQLLQGTDLVGSNVVRFMTFLVPNYKELSRTIAENGPLVNGFDIFNTLLARQCLTTFVFVGVVVLISYFFLKTREIAA